jgi:hypothetical protein
MWYLPKVRNVSLQHFHDIWQGRKRVYLQQEISQIYTPQ